MFFSRLKFQIIAPILIMLAFMPLITTSVALLSTYLLAFDATLVFNFINIVFRKNKTKKECRKYEDNPKNFSFVCKDERLAKSLILLREKRITQLDEQIKENKNIIIKCANTIKEYELSHKEANKEKDKENIIPFKLLSRTEQRKRQNYIKYYVENENQKYMVSEIIHFNFEDEEKEFKPLVKVFSDNSDTIYRDDGVLKYYQNDGYSKKLVKKRIPSLKYDDAELKKCI